MTPARHPDPTPTSSGRATDDNAIATRDSATGHELSADIDEKSQEAEGPLSSDASDLGAPKEFKEGGYGWYVGLESGH